MAARTHTNDVVATTPTWNCLLVGQAGGSQQGDLEKALQSRDCTVEVCNGLDDARARLRESVFELVVLDCRDEWIDAASISLDWAPTASIFVTGTEQHRDQMHSLLAAGVTNFACDPFDLDQIAATMVSQAKSRWFETEARRLQLAMRERPVEDFFVGRSPAMRRLDGAIRRGSEIDATVLVEGAPGTGKSLIARTLHESGRRSGGPAGHGLGGLFDRGAARAGVRGRAAAGRC